MKGIANICKIESHNPFTFSVCKKRVSKQLTTLPLDNRSSILSTYVLKSCTRQSQFYLIHIIISPEYLPELVVWVDSQDVHPLPFPPWLTDSVWDQVPPGVGFGPSGVALGPLLSLLPFVLAAAHFESAFGLFLAGLLFLIFLRFFFSLCDFRYLLFTPGKAIDASYVLEFFQPHQNNNTVT